MVSSSSALPLHHAGAIVRVEGALLFLPSEVVRKFVIAPAISDVSGTGLSMALVEGQVLTVLPVGVRGAALTVCEVGGEQVGLLGAHPEEVGFFEADGSGVRYSGKLAPQLDVAELVRASALGTGARLEPAL